ncbi:MAG: division plane positioning ATPase MipZ [Kiloniellales bacterium]|nr:division plane positioning ATPase MipZ [Kiloniellales bacterium]
MTAVPSRIAAGRRRGPASGKRASPNPAAALRLRVAKALQQRVIVLGNEKGGSGKSTTAMHITVSLLKQGRRVGCIDLDARQGSLSRYVENRRNLMEETGLKLPLPEVRRIYRSEKDTRSAAEAEERAALDRAMEELRHCDSIVIDTPGSDNYLSRIGHAQADVLITPLNDSFLDLDLLARIDADGRRVLAPSIYSQMVWEQRQRRAKRGLPPIDWVVMRNRLSHVNARNKRDVGQLLEQLAKRIGFRLAPGFGERVIFRELFPKGLTLLDLREKGAGVRLNMSHIAARQEVRELFRAVGLEDGEAPGQDRNQAKERAEQHAEAS